MQNIHNITVSGRIGSGTTTVAKGIATHLNWELLEGGELFEKFFNQNTGHDSDRPDDFDLDYENKIKDLLTSKKRQVIQSHLAGFDAQNIPGVYKILVLCEDEQGNDMPKERAKRLTERKGINLEDALKEVEQREKGNLTKWRRLYAQNDPTWVYWDKKYYDLVINTAKLNQEEALKKALSGLTQITK